MPKIMIKLTPLEPYFFGGERIFEIGDGNRHYFIRSLDEPSQTTLFGALRYIGIENPEKANYILDNNDKENVGEHSFDLISAKLSGSITDSAFGRISRISPLYIIDQGGHFFIRTPFDHKQKNEAGKLNEIYSPFEVYSDPVWTNNGERRFPMEFNAKDDLPGSWISLYDKRIHSDLFQYNAQVGIDKNHKEKAFFKKEYKILKHGFSFVFFADVSADFKPYNRIVYLGQGKSPFGVSWDWAFSEPSIPKDLIRPAMVYAQSDIYYPDNVNELYKTCWFVCVKLRDFRGLVTNYSSNNQKNRCERNKSSIKLIQAGSVFWPKDPLGFSSEIQKQDYAQIAGFNQIIIGGEA